MIRYISIGLFMIPCIIQCGGSTDCPKPTLLIDNSNGQHTITVHRQNKFFFIHPSEKKEIELLKSETGYTPIALLKGNRRYAIYIENKIEGMCVLNAPSMKEEGSNNSLRIVRILLGKAKL